MSLTEQDDATVETPTPFAPTPNTNRRQQPHIPTFVHMESIALGAEWKHPTYDDMKDYGDTTPTLAQIIEDYELCTAWVDARLNKTGFNIRKTTSQGVRRMTKSLRESGYLGNSCVTIYPADLPLDNQKVGTKAIKRLTEEDKKKGYRFLCADGMHRTRTVQELTALKLAGDDEAAGKCGSMVKAVIVRPDIPPDLLLRLSVGMYFFILLQKYLR